FYAVTDERLDNVPITLRTVTVQDVRWFVEQAGPRYLQHYRPADSTDTSTRDESGSGYGFRFLLACKQRGMNYHNALRAILADNGEAGEWARRKERGDIERAWKKAAER